MAAEDSNTVEFDRQELDDSISCCICTNIYTNPKALPCIHTFCMKCLQEIGLKMNKGPGDEMPCPVCRREFEVPEEGFCGLPNNFFIARLIEVANVSDSLAPFRALCNACAEEIEETEQNEGRGKEIPTAEMYCNDCKQMLCEECSRHHRKLKFTKNHKLMPLNDQQVSDEKAKTDLAPSACEIHEQRVLEIYCAECRTVECAVCFIDSHMHHKGSHVSKFVDEFRKQIESNIETINLCSSQTQMKKEELTKVRDDMQKKVEKLEFDVLNRRDELKQFVDSQANSLLESLWSLRQSKFKEIQMEAEDIEAHLFCLQSYSSYCQKIMATGSACDICRAVSDLSVRAIELQQQCQLRTERELQVFKFCFMKLEFEEFLADCNLIGEIEEESQSELKKRFNLKLSLTEEPSSETDHLKNEIKVENEQFQMSVDKKMHAKNILEDELSDKMTDSTDLSITEKFLQELLQELDVEKTKGLTLKVDKDKLIWELNTKRVEAEKLREELVSKKALNKTLQTSTAKLRRQLDCEVSRNKMLYVNNKKLKQRLACERITMKKLRKGEGQDYEDWEKAQTDRAKILDRKKKLEQEKNVWIDEKEQLNKQIKEQQRLIAELRYRFDPVLVKRIKTNVTNKKKEEIYGLTILDKELFVVSGNSSVVEVYESTRFRFSRKWRLRESLNPMDIASCNRNKCLYIFSSKGHHRSHKILRVDPNGNFIKKWPTEDGGGLSVTDESNVILTGFSANKITEYSPDGQLIHEIYLCPHAGFIHPLHVIKLTNGHFVVSHGYDNDELHRVCIVNADGELKKSFGGECGSTIRHVHCPIHIAIDGSGFVMVADRNNSRVLLLDSDLEFKKEILLSNKHGLKDPWRIFLDDTNGRLFVLDRGWETWDSTKQLTYSREILIFEF